MGGSGNGGMWASGATKNKYNVSNISLIYRGHPVGLCMMAVAFYKRDGPGKYSIPAFGHVVVRPTSFLFH